MIYVLSYLNIHYAIVNIKEVPETLILHAVKIPEVKFTPSTTTTPLNLNTVVAVVGTPDVQVISVYENALDGVHVTLIVFPDKFGAAALNEIEPELAEPDALVGAVAATDILMSVVLGNGDTHNPLATFKNPVNVTCESVKKV